MARVSVRRGEDRNWERGPAVTAEQGRRRSGRCVHHEGSATRPQLFEVELGPDQEVGLHAHEHDEIIYVVDGSLVVGQQVLRPGSSLAIAGGTVYGFRAGTDGVHFLNFRPCFDEGVLTVEEARARRRAVAASATGADLMPDLADTDVDPAG